MNNQARSTPSLSSYLNHLIISSYSLLSHSTNPLLLSLYSSPASYLIISADVPCPLTLSSLSIILSSSSYYSKLSSSSLASIITISLIPLLISLIIF